jgi:pumilio RNA-binding family
MGNVKLLCVSPFGNYIIQQILEKGPPAEKEKVLDYLKKNFGELSQNKFASNVTEKSVIHGTPTFRDEVMQSLIKGNGKE